MITLADLRARNALPSWQEAVAIVQELSHATLARGAAARLPDVEHIGLSADGTVASLPGGPVPDDPVRHLAVLVDLLLEDITAPPQLVDLVQRNRSDPPEAASVEEFVKALAFFERPGRRDDIAALVARASLAEEQTRADEELRRLKARAQEAEKPREEAPPPKAAARRGVVLPLAVAAILIGMVGAAGVLGWRAQRSTQDASAAAQSGEVAGGEADPSAGAVGTPSPSKSSSLLARVGDVVKAAFTSSSPTPEVVPPPTPPAPVAPPRVRRRPAARAASAAERIDSTSPDEPATDPVKVITIELGGYPLPPEPPADAAAESAEREAVYTSGDLSVLPPTIVRPVIPPPPAADAPPESMALFDLVVDRQGRVERVRLASTPSRFHERMILSHIKAWTFQPAMKDGRPVRYRLRVLLTV